MTTYDVTVTREGNLWVADASSDVLGPAAMDYEHLTELHEDLPLFIADLLNVDPSDVTITYRYEINGQDVTEPLARLQQLQKALRRTQIERDHARAEVLETLSHAGLSQRAIADAVGVSKQRISQLARAGG